MSKQYAIKAWCRQSGAIGKFYECGFLFELVPPLLENAIKRIQTCGFETQHIEFIDPTGETT